MANTKVAYRHSDADGVFAFHQADGKLVEITADKAYSTADAGEIAYLDTVSFVKRAKSDSGKEE